MSFKIVTSAFIDTLADSKCLTHLESVLIRVRLSQAGNKWFISFSGGF